MRAFAVLALLLLAAVPGRALSPWVDERSPNVQVSWGIHVFADGERIRAPLDRPFFEAEAAGEVQILTAGLRFYRRVEGGQLIEGWEITEGGSTLRLEPSVVESGSYFLWGHAVGSDGQLKLVALRLQANGEMGMNYDIRAEGLTIHVQEVNKGAMVLTASYRPGQFDQERLDLLANALTALLQKATTRRKHEPKS